MSVSLARFDRSGYRHRPCASGPGGRGAPNLGGRFPGRGASLGDLLPALQDLYWRNRSARGPMSTRWLLAGPGGLHRLVHSLFYRSGAGLGAGLPGHRHRHPDGGGRRCPCQRPSAWSEGDVVWCCKTDGRTLCGGVRLAVTALGGRCRHPSWGVDGARPPLAQQAPAHLAGSGLQAYPDAFASVAEGPAGPMRHRVVRRWPNWLARPGCGGRMWWMPPWPCLCYVRDKVAQTTAERMAARA